MNNLKLYNYYQTMCLGYKSLIEESGSMKPKYFPDQYPDVHLKIMKLLSLESTLNNMQLILNLKTELINDIY